jgi:hypothetical protein
MSHWHSPDAAIERHPQGNPLLVAGIMATGRSAWARIRNARRESTEKVGSRCDPTSLGKERAPKADQRPGFHTTRDVPACLIKVNAGQGEDELTRDLASPRHTAIPPSASDPSTEIVPRPPTRPRNHERPKPPATTLLGLLFETCEEEIKTGRRIRHRNS